jgi:hypothetical protein
MKWLVRVPLAVMLGLFLAIPATVPAEAASTRNLFYGDAYGSYGFVGQNAMTGRTTVHRHGMPDAARHAHREHVGGRPR